MSALVTALQVGLVFALLGGFALYMRRHATRTSKGATLTVVARSPLAGRSSVAVVEVGGHSYVLGVTEQHVTVVDKLEGTLTVPGPNDVADGDAPAAPAPFGAYLAAARNAEHRPPETLGAAIVDVIRRFRNRAAAQAPAGYLEPGPVNEPANLRPVGGGLRRARGSAPTRRRSVAGVRPTNPVSRPLVGAAMPPRQVPPANPAAPKVTPAVPAAPRAAGSTRTGAAPRRTRTRAGVRVGGTT